MVADEDNVKPRWIVFDPNNADSYKYAVESRFKQMGCLDIARGKRKLEDFESEASDVEDSDVEERNMRFGELAESCLRNKVPRALHSLWTLWIEKWN